MSVAFIAHLCFFFFSSSSYIPPDQEALDSFFVNKIFLYDCVILNGSFLSAVNKLRASVAPI
jgi:hypothetical protein